MARKFFYGCADMLMLALAYHLGASRAGAQAGEEQKADSVFRMTIRARVR